VESRRRLTAWANGTVQADKLLGCLVSNLKFSVLHSIYVGRIRTT
jgi:hypothetical protein